MREPKTDEIQAPEGSREARIQSLLKTSREDEALELLEAWLLGQPASRRARDLELRALHLLGRREESREKLDRLLLAEPDSFRWHRTALCIALDDARFEDAVECGRRALAIRPDHAATQEGLIIALAKLDRIEECAAELESSLASTPNGRTFARTYQILLVSLEWRQWARTLPLIERALESSPGDDLLMQLQASTLARLGRSEEARGLLEQAVAECTPTDGLLLGLSQAQRLVGDPSGALETLNRVFIRHGLSPLETTHPQQVLDLRYVRSRPAPAINDGPLVSIVLTTHRWRELSEVAIRSNLQQTWRHLELIVVDDGSTDENFERLQRLAERDSRLRVLRLPLNSGTYVAKNFGLSVAAGEFVTFADSDNWVHPERIEHQVASFSTGEYVATLARAIKVSETGDLMIQPRHNDAMTGFDSPALRPSFISLMIRRDVVLDRLGFFDSVRVSADAEYCRRLEVAFGPHSVHRSTTPVSLNGTSRQSLTGGGEFEIDWRGLRLPRAQYRAESIHWHRQIRHSGKSPFLASPLVDRPFPAPPEMIVFPPSLDSS